MRTFALANKQTRCHSSVGRAKDWKSLCPRFDSWWHHLQERFSSTRSVFFVLIQIEQRTGRNINTGNMIQMNSSNYFCRKTKNEYKSLFFSNFIRVDRLPILCPTTEQWMVRNAQQSYIKWLFTHIWQWSRLWRNNKLYPLSEPLSRNSWRY